MGARGPLPDPNAIRRDRKDDQATWTDLPQKREGPTPPWPAYMGEPHPDSMKARLWAELWSMPQAVMWERNRQHIEVAQHVETLCDIETGPPDGVKSDPTPTLRGLVLRQQKTLGLSIEGLTRNRWRVASTTTTEAPKTDGRRRPSAKERLAKIVELESRRPA